jgi:VWFA-related protein
MTRVLQPTNIRRALTAVAFLVALIVPLGVPNLRATPQAGQNPPAKPAPTQDASSEISSSDNQSIIRLRVPVVVVRVVVKDAAGNIVYNLRKEDFQIQDNNKAQEISTFATEHPASRIVRNFEEEVSPVKAEAADVKPPEIAVAGRYVALLLDDIHIQQDAALAVRVQSMNVIQSLHSKELVAVYSTSGRIQQDFTTDREALSEAVSRFMPNPITSSSNGVCPQITYFQAQLMVDFKDADATDKAVNDFWSCKYGKIQQNYATAILDATQTARNIVGIGDVELEQAMRRIREIVNRLSEMPGDRAIVFVSPGFASTDTLGKVSPILDRAIRANVVVNTVDARGLYVPDASLDASSPGPCMAGSMNPSAGTGGCSPESGTRFQMAQQSAMKEVLASLALGTGGTWFQNSNDLGKGIHDALSSPSTSYVLAFSPANRTLDGKFHKLKVTVAGSKNVTVQARPGYFAAKPASDPEKQAEADFHDALFGQDEINDIPVDVRTKFFVKQTNEASLSVLTRIDVKGVHFRKVSGRNYDEVTVGVAIFDDHGEFVAGNQRTLTLRLLDETLARVHNSGINVKMDFDVKPGTYLVRVVSRESEGAKMAAHNGAVVIPN